MTYYRVYIGKLPRDVTKREVERLIGEFGRCVETSTHSGFAFVEFYDDRSAKDCVRTLDGERYAGVRLRVEPARTQNSGRWKDDGYDGRSPRYGGGKFTRGDYRIVVSELPSRTSWQDLKDLMRKAGEVVYTDIAEDGSGIVEFSNAPDMDRALHLFDGYEFQGRVLKVSEGMPSDCRSPSPEPKRRSKSSRRWSRSPPGGQSRWSPRYRNGSRSTSPPSRRSPSVERCRGGSENCDNDKGVKGNSQNDAVNSPNNASHSPPDSREPPREKLIQERVAQESSVE